MYNFKYFTLKELDEFIENLQKVIDHLEKKARTERENMALRNDQDMKNAAEYELMERTLLQKKNDGGCSN
jgi:hypothetical protein